MPATILGDVDYDVVYSQVKAFLPAFVKEAVDRAVRYSVSRNNGGVDFTIQTQDIVDAAIGLQRQLDLMNDAKEGDTGTVTIDSILKDTVASTARTAVRTVMNRSVISDANGDFDGRINTK